MRRKILCQCLKVRRDKGLKIGIPEQYRVDGIILASTSLSSELSEECATAGIPVVLFNRTTERDAVSTPPDGSIFQ